jgi:hypothetical protein
MSTSKSQEPRVRVPRVLLLCPSGCRAFDPTLELLQRVLREEGIPDAVECVAIPDADAAAREGHRGSPAVQMEGEDLDPAARAAPTGLG